MTAAIDRAFQRVTDGRFIDFSFETLILGLISSSVTLSFNKMPVAMVTASHWEKTEVKKDDYRDASTATRPEQPQYKEQAA